jgi:hypothetical protein
MTESGSESRRLSTTESASAKVLSAKIRVLEVGSGQITMSVYRQLDAVSLERFEPFGRVKDNKLKSGEGALHLVGRDTRTGALVRYDVQPLPTEWPTRAAPSEFVHWQIHTKNDISYPCPVAESPNGRHVLWTRTSPNCPNDYRWHISQKKPRVAPWDRFLDWYVKRERGPCTVDLDKLKRAWRAEAKAQLAEILKREAEYEAFATLPLIVLPD